MDKLHLRTKARAEKPKISLSPQMGKYLIRARQNPELMGIFWSLLATREESGKGGASHQISSNGVWSFSDPKDATKEKGERNITGMVANVSKFIQTWKQVPPEKIKEENDVKNK